MTCSLTRPLHAPRVLALTRRVVSSSSSARYSWELTFAEPKPTAPKNRLHSQSNSSSHKSQPPPPLLPHLSDPLHDVTTPRPLVEPTTSVRPRLWSAIPLLLHPRASSRRSHDEEFFGLASRLSLMASFNTDHHTSPCPPETALQDPQ